MSCHSRIVTIEGSGNARRRYPAVEVELTLPALQRYYDDDMVVGSVCESISLFPIYPKYVDTQWPRIIDAVDTSHNDLCYAPSNSHPTRTHLDIHTPRKPWIPSLLRGNNRKAREPHSRPITPPILISLTRYNPSLMYPCMSSSCTATGAMGYGSAGWDFLEFQTPPSM